MTLLVLLSCRNPNHPELALWAHPWRHGEEWSFDSHPHSDHMDTSAQDTDLSNLDTSNLDTVPNSLNTSMQSYDSVDLVRMDTSTGDPANDSGDVVIQEGSHIVADVNAGTTKETDPEKTPSDTNGNVGMAQSDGSDTGVSGEAKHGEISSEQNTATVQEVSNSAIQRTEEQPQSVPVTSESTEKSGAKDELKKETENMTKDGVDKSDGPEVVKSPNDNNKPAQTDGRTDKHSESVKSSEQTLPKPSEGSVFGLQAVKESKLSECLVPLCTDSSVQNSKVQPSENIVSATSSDVADVDKPGPSGLQQQMDVSQPGPSGVEQSTGDTDKASTSATAEVQQPSEDPDKPGPSGLQTADVPSTSGDAGVAMEVDAEGSGGVELPSQGDANQLLATGVKVTGSSVWTAVQVK